MRCGSRIVGQPFDFKGLAVQKWKARNERPVMPMALGGNENRCLLLGRKNPLKAMTAVFVQSCVTMENIHSPLTVSISEFKQNPGKVVEEAHGQPVAVLNHKRPAFYAVSPELMAQMAELYDERQLAALAQSRLKSSANRAVKVNLDDL